MEISGKKADIGLGTKGKIVFLKAKKPEDGYTDWVLLISEIVEDVDSKGKPYPLIKRYISHKVNNKKKFISVNHTRWGNLNNYDAYEPTDEQVQIIKNILKKHKLKYVRAFNKIIQR